VARVVFSTWRGEFIDNRGKPEEEWVESEYKLPEQYEADRNAKAFIGWDGFAIFDESVDVVRLGTEYAQTYQKYSEACGRCAPGRWGGRILYDLMDKIARGEGEVSDLEHLKEVSRTMMETSKCEIGRTVPKPLLDMMEHYRDTFMELIEKKEKSPGYDDTETRYVAKVTAPCMDACPTHVDIPAYIEGVRDLRYDDSLKATRKSMPLAHTCGRVCPHPCEDECRRANLDEPISIMELKRIGADYETDRGFEWLHPEEPAKEKTDKRVAIVGAGPAGLTAAYYLGVKGIQCDVYEKLQKLDIPLERIDSKDIRELVPDVGYSRRDRNRHIKRIGHLIQTLQKNSISTVASFVSPYRESRKTIRTMVRNNIVVYVKASVDTCKKRDYKGVYEKALNGELQNFTGVSDVYEEPQHAEIVIDTEKTTPEEAAERIFRYVKKNYVR